MIPGLRGSLLSHDAVAGLVPSLPEEDARRRARRVLLAWHREVRDVSGPAWSSRAVFDRIATPVCEALGFQVVPTGGSSRIVRAILHRQNAARIALCAFGWGQDDGTVWRESVRGGIDAGLRWCFGVAGHSLRVYDATRTHSRRYAEFDLDTLATDPSALAVAWSVLAGEAALDAAALRSDQHRAAVRDSLQVGVHEAVIELTRAFAASSRRAARSPHLLDESLMVIYRVLFLLFAEARGLVPAWHPVYRESYTIESLRMPVEKLERPLGVWATIQAISRLAHRGCRAGTLRVPPFNGRLFAPSGAPLADTVPLDDRAVRNALLSLTTRPSRGGRERIAYGDLGVEQLGGVYERVLDYDLTTSEAAGPVLVRGGRRKATGTFYTPRALTEHLVRRTLSPLVDGASPERILSLRILDPAMGSGAFLVAACRYLARAYEAALSTEGGITAADITDAERAGFRRVIAQRCLYGVDLNPMAVQLARLSLWLTTFAGDRPLTFFDHHLRTGNSLVGTTLAAVRRGHPSRNRRPGPLPLFDDAALDDAIAGTVTSYQTLRDGPEDTLEQVRAKEQRFAELQGDAAPIARWKRIADLWCAAWFDPALRHVNRGLFESLLRTGLPALSASVEASLLERTSAVASLQRFFHWELEFPDVFHPREREAPGFDAVIGNPPWEMTRGDAGDERARTHAARAGSTLTRFARESGTYRLQGAGHANLYQMFVERSLALVRDGGRLGLVLPFGIASDHGCSALRRHLLGRTAIDSFTVVENHDRLFPIHRSLKFVALTLTSGGAATTELPIHAGVRSAQQLDQLPESGADPLGVSVPVRLIERLCGEQLAVPELRSPLDVRIASAIAFGVPSCGDPSGWGLRFGRELNATDDRRHFNTSGRGLPVIEGKHIQPFTVNVTASRQHVRAATVERLLGRRPFERPRLAYRDVSSATNRLTLIAAVLPPDTITTHTLFCLRTPLDEEAQYFVCGMFNSFVANYLVRLRVTTHVSVSIIERLPLPMPARTSREFQVVSTIAARLSRSELRPGEQEELQAAAARLYGLGHEAFAHVLSTFPLVDSALRAAALMKLSCA